ncbi:MAG: pyridoxal-phosphate dependent enzyme [Gammaproteobacteria bacterium]
METAAYIDTATRETYPLAPPLWRAPGGGPLMLTPLPGISRDRIEQDLRSIWRYQAAFPTGIESPVTLGEGMTPLLSGSFAGNPCHFKLEWFSPTGSFKDRGASIMISFLKQQGIRAIVEDSSGNGGAAIAAYGAAAGMQVRILVPDSTQPAKIAQSRAYGAEVMRVPGTREATEAAAIEMSGDIFYAGHNWHPFFLQGTKTLGYEIWEDLAFTVPDNIVIPSAAGSNLLGCFIAFKELIASGETKRLPRLFASQPANCAPLHASFEAGADDHVETEFESTIAEGTAIRRPIRLREMLHALRESGGGTVALREDEIAAASLQLASQGLYVEPTAAHAAAAFDKLCDCDRIRANERTVVILTGTGLKAMSYYAQTLG